jgi:NADP-dependent 3-hydroxy acid dehydrogenase YdfG
MIRLQSLRASSSGLGRATALAFARAGAKVVLIARSEEELVSVASEIEAEGGKP